jgi:hypothetical protein
MTNWPGNHVNPPPNPGWGTPTPPHKPCRSTRVHNRHPPIPLVLNHPHRLKRTHGPRRRPAGTPGTHTPGRRSRPGPTRLRQADVADSC